MKTSLHSLLGAGLLSLLTTTAGLATDNDRNPDRNPSSSGWVTAPNASFSVRTYQDTKGDLVVQLNNPSLRSLTIQMQTLRGEEVAYVPVSRRQAQFGVKLDVTELPDGDYRLIVATDNERVVKTINLKTPGPATRQASVVVVGQVADR